ncbi:hypothetical protein RND81_03G014300 [Saponaria officinalis]|uniref:DUF4283 domain-containing protein n=1 Tax=Saponaria officinalis TaxID=3572 RepID=A0AAW1M4I1_SAPOF
MAVICYILGANPHVSVITGFINRIWRHHGYDNISFLQNGVFLVHFPSKEARAAIVQGGYVLFDNKPLIVRPWSADVPLRKEKVVRVPVWIRLHDVELKFWGKHCLERFAGEVGKVVKCDLYTEQRLQLAYERKLVELEMDQALVTKVKFFDEKDALCIARVEYEWLPVMCASCNGFGHKADTCVRKKMTKVELFGLLETKIRSRGVSRLLDVLGNNWSYCTNHVSHDAGRVWVLWNPNLFTVSAIESDAQGIHLKVMLRPGAKQFWLSMIYGFNSAVQRIEMWERLRSLHAIVQGPWLWCGDFNCVLARDERIGQPLQLAEIRPFLDCVNWCGMSDIKAVGSFFTWNNKQGPLTRIYSRLDRAMHNDDWGLEFQDTVTHFLPEGLFDHCPCLISLLGKVEDRKTSFKYFNMWSLAPEFKAIVARGWDRQVVGCPMYRVVQKLKGLKGMFRKLNRSNFSNVEQNTQVAYQLLLECQRRVQALLGDCGLVEEEQSAADTYVGLKKKRDEFFKQKAKAMWYDYGDDNTAFFHSIIRLMRRANKVLEIRDLNGQICTNSVGINAAFEDYYKRLLGTSTSVDKIHFSTARKGPLVSADHAKMLLAPVLGEEMMGAMFDIPGIKAPRPDGYSDQFFKNAWEVVGSKVIKAVQDFFNSGKLLK